MTAWAAATSVTLAFARSAMARWAATGMARSSVASSAHDGTVCHSGRPAGLHERGRGDRTLGTGHHGRLRLGHVGRENLREAVRTDEEVDAARDRAWQQRVGSEQPARVPLRVARDGQGRALVGDVGGDEHQGAAFRVTPLMTAPP